MPSSVVILMYTVLMDCTGRIKQFYFITTKFDAMQSIPVFLIIRLVIGLLIGLLITRKLKSTIRAIVVQCMPMKYRISPKSFYAQTRITTVISILLILAIMIGFNELGEYTGRSLGITRTASTKIHQAAPKEILPSVTKQKAAVLNLNDHIPETNLVEPKATNFEKITPISSTIEYQDIKAPSSYPKLIIDRPVYLSDQYFAQVAALTSLSQAQAAQAQWTNQLNTQSWIAIDETSYKVLIGPFATRQATRQFIRSNKLNAFPRTGKTLRFLKEE